MKNFKYIILSAIFTLSIFSFSSVYAQTKIEIPPVEIVSHFERSYAPIQSSTWTVLAENDVNYYFGSYTIDGDSKIAAYHNGHYLALLTQVPLEYCPRSIKQLNDSINEDFTPQNLYLMQSTYGNYYISVLTKGKRKKAVTKYVYFSVQGELIGETPEKLPYGVINKTL